MSLTNVLGTLGDSLTGVLADVFTAIGPWNVLVEHCQDPRIELSDEKLASPLLWVIDGEEHLASDSNGQTYEEVGLLLTLQMKIFENPAQQKDVTAETLLWSLSGYLGMAMRYLKPLERDDANDYVPLIEADGSRWICVKAQRQQSRDWQRWHENRVFYAEALTHWRRY